MKKLSLNLITCLVVTGTMLASTGLFAKNREGGQATIELVREGKGGARESVSKKINLVVDFYSISELLDLVLAVEGTTSNPDPSENEQLQATIASNVALIDQDIDHYVGILHHSGLSKKSSMKIEQAHKSWVIAALNYASKVNLGNTGHAGGTQADQNAAADSFLEVGARLAVALAEVVEPARKQLITSDVMSMTVLTTELAQADRGVLSSRLVDPANVQSEANAATRLHKEIEQIAAEIGKVLADTL